MRFVYFVRRHPLMCTLLAFFVGTLPQWAASVWSLFNYDEALVPWLLRHHLPHIAFSPWFITAPIGALMFATVLVIEWNVPFIPKKKVEKLQQRHAALLASGDGTAQKSSIASHATTPAKAFSEPIKLGPRRLVVVPPPPASQNVPPNAGPLSNRTPRELFEFFAGHTPLQVVKLIAPYKGLWIEAEGPLAGPPSPHGDGCAATLYLDTEGKQHVECRFGQQWCDVVDGLQTRTVIKVRGKIETHFGVTLALSECELISPMPR
jgi:hypothetical protein